MPRTALAEAWFSAERATPAESPRDWFAATAFCQLSYSWPGVAPNPANASLSAAAAGASRASPETARLIVVRTATLFSHGDFPTSLSRASR